MNKRKITEYVKELQKEICRMCEEGYEACIECRIYNLTNKILDELNGE